MIENKEHEHADLLRAIADGKQIQVFTGGDVTRWANCDNRELLILVVKGYVLTWRIKPEPKPDIIRHVFVEVHPKLDSAYNKPNLRLTFDGETHKLKHAEVLNAEE